MDKNTVKLETNEEKFNVFDQDSRDEEAHIELEKPLKEVSARKRASRPGSVDSSEAMVLKSSGSRSQEIFEGRKSMQNYRKGHLEVREREGSESVEEIHLEGK